MKVKSVIYLTKEELDKINDAFNILEEYHEALFSNKNTDEDLREIVSETTSAIDIFLCAYAERYEE